MKNILRLGMILAVLAVACMAIVGAGSAGDSGLSWSVTDHHLDITYDGVGTGIMDDYKSCGPWGTGITSVSLPDGLKSIGNNAFNGCTKLTEVAIPGTVTDIGDSAFFNCYKIEEIVLPSGVTIIENNVFNGCYALKYVSLPSDISSIGYTSFTGCEALASINIPSTVTSIGDYAFYNNAQNSILYTQGDISYFSGVKPKYSVDRTAIAKDNGDNSYTFIFDNDSFTTGFPLTYINAPVKSTATFEGWYADSSCTGDIITKVSTDQKTVYAKWTGTPSEKYKVTYSGDSNGTISATVKEYSLTSGYKVDGGSNVVFTITPNSGYVLSTFTVNGVDKWSEAVGGTYIIENISENTKVAATFATGGSCGDGLTWKVIDNNLTIMYDGVGTGVMDDYTADNPAPWGTSITSLLLPEGLKSIGNSAFNGCSNITGNLTIPSNVTSIGNGAFAGCNNITGTITIPDTVTTIGDDAFESCSGIAGSLCLPPGLTYLGTGAFAGCSGINGLLSIPTSLSIIPGYAFYGCSITDLSLHENLTEIGYVAFCNCKYLSSVHIPSNVTLIADGAFSDCTSLTEINVDSSNTNFKVVNGVLFSMSGDRLICYPAGLLNETYSIPDGVESIGSAAFGSCNNLKQINIPNSVNYIGGWGFSRCTSLISISIPEGVENIESNVFQSCTSIENITLPSTINSIDNYAFSGCDSLKKIVLPEGLTSIAPNAINYSVSLRSISIPSTLTTIQQGTFFSLPKDSILYIHGDVSFSSNAYSTERTAIAKDNGDNSFTFTIDTSSFPSGFTLSSENAPVEDGYTFDGWYANAQFSGEKVTVTTNGQTLYAKWTESPVEVSTSNITFTTQKEGYTVPDEKLVTVSNNTDSTTVTVSASSENFTYSGLGDITSRQFAVIHVQPVSGLSSGEYSDVIHITYNDGSSVVDTEVSVKFSVIKTPGKEEETVIPDLPEMAVKTDAAGNTVSVETSSGFVTSSGTEPENQTATIQKSSSDVKLDITKATVTDSGGNSKVELSPDSEITAVYPETSADNKQKVTESTYSLDVGIETVDGNLPTISGEFDSNVSMKVEGLGYTAEYMISATNTDLTGINENVSTVTVRFTVNNDKLPADRSKVKIIHTSKDKYGSEFTEILTPTFTPQGTDKTIVSASSTHGFSSYTLGYEDAGGELVTSIIINGASEVYAGSQVTLTATVLPSTATNKAVIWSSSDTSTATVDSEGKVTALKTGTVTITAAATDGSEVTGSKTITVLNKEYSVTFSGDSHGTVTATANKTLIASGSPVSAGSHVVFTLTPQDGYRLSTFTVNGTDMTSEAVSGTYAIASLSEDTSAAATFESVPVATHAVTFNTMSHGITQPATQYVADGDTATDPGKLFESGYVFGGWYTDSACTIPYGFSTPVTGDFTLYAKWTIGEFTVSTSNVTFDTRTVGGSIPNERVVTITNLTDSSIVVVSASSPDFKYSGLGEIPAETSTEIRIQPLSTVMVGEYSDTILIRFKDSLSTVEKTVTVNFSVVEAVPQKEEVTIKPEVPSIDTKIDDATGKTTEVETASETVTTSGTVPGEQTATIQKDDESVKIQITNATVAVSGEETKVELTDASKIAAVYPETLAENRQEVQEAAYTLDVELETPNPYLPTISGEYDTAVSQKVEAMGYTVEYMISTTNTDVSTINENVKSVTASFIIANDKIPENRSRAKIVHTSTDNDPEEFTEVLTPTFTRNDDNTTTVSATSERGFSAFTFVVEAANAVASGGESTSSFFGNYQGDNTYTFDNAVVVTDLIVPEGSDISQKVKYTNKSSGMPEEGYYQFTLSAPGYNSGKNGKLFFQILLGDLGVKGYDTNDIVLKKGDTELTTYFMNEDNRYAYYQSDITDEGTYVICFVRDGSKEMQIQKVSSEPGYLNIKSTPQHAEITINGVSYGETPQTGIELEPGTYAIKLELDWYNPYAGTVTIKEGETTDFYQRLEQTDERKDAAKTPFPIIGVLAGLGVAGVLVLRRR